MTYNLDLGNVSIPVEAYLHQVVKQISEEMRMNEIKKKIEGGGGRNKRRPRESEVKKIKAC